MNTKLKKLISGFLILAELVFWIFGVSFPNIALAQGVPDPAGSISFKFTSTSNTEIVATNNGIDYRFTSIGPISPDKINVPSRLNTLGIKQDIWGFELTTPQKYCYQSNGLKPTLIVGREDSTWKYNVAGLFVHPDVNYDNWLLISLGLASNCSDLIGDSAMQPLVNVANADPSVLRSVVTWATVDTPGTCSDLASSWDIMKSNARDILATTPESNPNWSKTETTGATTEITYRAILEIALLPVGGIAAGPIAMGWLGNVFPDWYSNLITSTIDYNLTSQGIEKVRTIRERAMKMREEIAQLSADGKGSTWPCPQKLTKFKFVEPVTPTASDYFTSLDELAAAIDPFLVLFDKFKAKFDEPVSTAQTEDKVCEIKDQGYITNMIAQAFCGLIVNIKSWVDGIYCWSLGLLESSIGVATSEQQTDANTKKPADVCSGSSISATAPVTTPVVAPSATALSTTAQMNISSSVYSTFKTAATGPGAWATIRKTGASSGDITGTISLSNWDDVHWTVSARIQTSTAIPADWTNITIFGGAKTSTGVNSPEILYRLTGSKSSSGTWSTSSSTP